MELVLKKNELIDLSDTFKDHRVICSRGYCCLTRQGDSRDLIMYCGSEALVDDRAVILTALSDVRLKVVAKENPH